MDPETAAKIRQRIAFINDKISKGNEFITKYWDILLEDKAAINKLYPEREKLLRYLQSDIQDLVKKISGELNLRRKVLNSLISLHGQLKEAENPEIKIETIHSLYDLLITIKGVTSQVIAYLDRAGV